MKVQLASIALIAAAVLFGQPSESMAGKRHDHDKHHGKDKHHGRHHHGHDGHHHGRHHHNHNPDGTPVYVGDAPAAPACITDCACVLENCPVGDASCDACWWVEHTMTPCAPSPDEEQEYGWSCPAAQ